MELKRKQIPILIEVGEWYYKGCFIQLQNQYNHPELLKYHIFKDTENQETIKTCGTFSEAKLLCDINEVKNPVSGWKEQLKIN